MRIETSFIVPLPRDRAWELLLDVPRIVPCVPGASLTEDLGEGKYRGQATVKIGPIQLLFAGEAEFTALDTENHTAELAARGADKKGRGNAAATVRFSLADEADGTRVNVATDLMLSGTVAQYGRAEGLIKSIANEIVRQFSTNLQKLLEREANGETGEATPDANAPLSALAVGIGALKSSFKR